MDEWRKTLVDAVASAMGTWPAPLRTKESMTALTLAFAEMVHRLDAAPFAHVRNETICGPGDCSICDGTGRRKHATTTGDKVGDPCPGTYCTPWDGKRVKLSVGPESVASAPDRYTAFPMSHDAVDHDRVLVWGIHPPGGGDELGLCFSTEEAAEAVAEVLGEVYSEGRAAGIRKCCDAVEEYARGLASKPWTP